MAILNNLIVYGESRLLGKLYCNDINIGNDLTVAGTTYSEGPLHVGKNTAANAKIFLNNKIAMRGTDAWLRINDAGTGETKFSSGVYFGSSLVRTDGSLQVGNNGAYLNISSSAGTISVPTTFSYTANSSGNVGLKVNGTASIVTGNITTVNSNMINNAGDIFNKNGLIETDRIKSNVWDITSTQNLGGSFYIAPTINVTNGSTFVISSVSGTTITGYLIDTTNITSSDFGGHTWSNNSLIKITGKLTSGNNHYILGTCSGKLTASMNTTANRINFQITCDASTVPPAGTYTITDGTVMMYNVSGSNKVGIQMTCYGANKYSYIDIYNGSNGDTPVARLGKLNGLETINGMTPTDYGIYTKNGFFKGKIVANGGTIGGWTIGDSYITTRSSRTSYDSTTNTGMTLSSGGIGAYNSANQKFTLSSDGVLTATGANITTATIGSGTNKITLGASTNTSYSAIKSGMTNREDVTNNGFYIGTDGIALGKGVFKVTDAGVLTANSGSIGDSVTIGGTAASIILTNITKAATTATKYITYIDATNGIRVYDGQSANNNVNYAQINSNGMQVYKSSTKVADFGESVVLGNEDDESHLVLDYHSLQLIDADGEPYVWFSDARDRSGVTEIQEQHTTSDYTYRIDIQHVAVSLIEVKKNNTVLVKDTDYRDYSMNKHIDFTNAIESGDIVTVTYTTEEEIKYYTIGKRGDNVTRGSFSVVEGYNNNGVGEYCHVEGVNNTTYGYGSHVEGTNNANIYGNYCHIEGTGHTVVEHATYAHVEGEGHEIYDTHAHVEGRGNYVSGSYAHVEGRGNEIHGNRAHAEGYTCIARGHNSHVQNQGTIAMARSETIIGEFNTYKVSWDYPNQRDTNAFVIGNGTSDSSRSNALTVDWNGIISARDKSGTFGDIFTLLYPVGSYYETSDTTFDPNTAWGGTWENVARSIVTNAATITVNTAKTYDICSVTLQPNTRYLVIGSTASSVSYNNVELVTFKTTGDATIITAHGRTMAQGGGGVTGWVYVDTHSGTSTVTIQCYGYYTTSHYESGKIVAIPLDHYSKGNVWHRTA